MRHTSLLGTFNAKHKIKLRWPKTLFYVSLFYAKVILVLEIHYFIESQTIFTRNNTERTQNIRICKNRILAASDQYLHNQLKFHSSIE